MIVWHRVWPASVLATLVACSGSGDDVVGPFSGTTHRFVVDRIDVPRDASQADAAAADLDGDGKADNKFGYATAVLAGTNDLSPHAAEMIAAGALASVVEIQADDLIDDATVGVRYFGADGDTESVVIGGRLAAGVFTPNRVRETTHPGAALARLPVFVNADPVTLLVEPLEIELAPDGAGGFDATVRGAMDERAAREAAHAGLVQMFETEPDRHLVFMRGVDENHDDVLSFDELEASVIGLLVSADVDIGDRALVSVAYRMHLAPCADGRCASGPPQMTCRDRIVDGTETDVDCGGACQPCADGLACTVPADCQSDACDGGRCRAATCNDGVRDGFESDIDCGGSCPACAVGKVCAADRDCTSNNCDNGIASLGACL